jgi:hypothetical protein
MTDLREAAQQALEALEGGAESWRLIGPAIDALKAALAEEALQRLTDANQEIEAALEQEPVTKSTWQKLYEAAIDQRNEAVAELRRLHAENVLLHERHHFDNGVLAELLQALKEATDAIEHWGSYSSDYFQQKWDLHSDINAARAAITRAEGKI